MCLQIRRCWSLKHARHLFCLVLFCYICMMFCSLTTQLFPLFWFGCSCSGELGMFAVVHQHAENGTSSQFTYHRSIQEGIFRFVFLHCPMLRSLLMVVDIGAIPTIHRENQNGTFCKTHTPFLWYFMSEMGILFLGCLQFTWAFLSFFFISLSVFHLPCRRSRQQAVHFKGQVVITKSEKRSVRIVTPTGNWDRAMINWNVWRKGGGLASIYPRLPTHGHTQQIL